MALIRRLSSLVGLLSPFAAAMAQRSVIGISGNIYRQTGDTIWMTRDTTATRAIFRADTVISDVMVNDRLKNHTVYVIRGDSATLVEFTNANSSTTRPMIKVPASIVGLVRQTMEMELRTRDMRAGSGAPEISRLDPPLRPDSILRYQLSPTRMMVQSHDTIRVIRGCPNARTDTAMFVLFGRDSTRRITEPPRTFGVEMAQALIADMRGVRLRERVTAMQSPLPPDFPRAPDPCR